MCSTIRFIHMYVSKKGELRVTKLLINKQHIIAFQETNSQISPYICPVFTLPLITSSRIGYAWKILDSDVHAYTDIQFTRRYSTHSNTVYTNIQYTRQ